MHTDARPQTEPKPKQTLHCAGISWVTRPMGDSLAYKLQARTQEFVAAMKAAVISVLEEVLIWRAVLVARARPV